MGSGERLARALLEHATIRNEAGAAEHAMELIDDAYSAAHSANAPDLAGMALCEKMYFQLLAWHFAACQQTLTQASRDLTTYSGAIRYQIALTAAQFFYLVDDFERALEQLGAAERFADSRWPYRTVTQIADPSRRRFVLTNMYGVLALIMGKWDEAIERAQALVRAPAMIESARFRLHIYELYVGGLAGRSRSEDIVLARTFVDECAAHHPDDRQRYLLVLAEVVGSEGSAGAEATIAAALEENLKRADAQPIDLDRDLGRLARAATRAGLSELAERIGEHERTFREKRARAAGAAWRGAPLIALESSCPPKREVQKSP